MHTNVFKFNFHAITHINKKNFFSFFQSRPCLSLLAYCYFYTQDFLAAANCYEKLIHLCPDEPVYKLYQAQALHQACLYPEAWSVCAGIASNPNLEVKVKKLQAAIKYGEEDTVTAKSYVDQCPPDDIDTEINLGCLMYQVRKLLQDNLTFIYYKVFFFLFIKLNLQEKEYEQALKKFSNALQITGFRPHLSYNVALCYYRLKQHTASLKHIGIYLFISKNHKILKLLN